MQFYTYSTNSHTGLIMKKTIFYLICTLFFIGNASASSVYHKTKITAIISDAQNYSGCMIRLEKGFSGISTCTRKDFVTLDCDGKGVNTKDSAAMLLNAAQLAFIAGIDVRLRINSDTIDGFCVADYVRMDK